MSQSSFPNDLRAICAYADEIVGPEYFDLQPTVVTIQTRVYQGGYRASTSSFAVTNSLTLAPYIHVRHITLKEVADSGGRYLQDDVMVGPIRPKWQGPAGETGGYLQSQLDPARFVAQDAQTHQGTDVVYILAQENPQTAGIFGEYTLKRFNQDDPLAYFLVLSRRKTTP